MTFSKNTFSTLVATTVLCSGSAMANDGISITGLNWDAARVITAVLEKTIESKFQTDVTVTDGITSDALESMDAGDGRYDIFPDIWMPNQKEAWQKYIVENQTIRHNKSYQAEQGFFLPAGIAESLGLQGIQDLNSPEVAAKFDTDGNGLGEYWAGESTWGVTALNQIKMKSYGLNELWEPWISKNEDFKVAFADAISGEKPILFYHWSPEWIFGAHEITQLAEPEYFDGCDQSFKPDERDDWLDASDLPCGFQTSDVFVFYSAHLEKSFPDVAEFLSGVSFDPGTINEWVLDTGVNQKAPEEVAENWIDNNPDVIASWVK